MISYYQLIAPCWADWISDGSTWAGVLQAGQTTRRATLRHHRNKFPDCAQYLAGDREQLGWDTTLSAWAALDTPGRLQMLVDAQLPMRQRRRLLAQLLSPEQPQGRSSLLRALMAQLAPHRLALCAELMRQEAQQLQVLRLLSLQYLPCMSVLLIRHTCIGLPSDSTAAVSSMRLAFGRSNGVMTPPRCS